MTSPAPQVSIGGVKPGRVVEYKRVSFDPPSRLVMSVDGPPKEGKSHFCLTAPEPIAIHNFDLGLEGVVDQEEFRDKEIYPFEYPMPLSAMLPGSEFNAMAEAASKVWKDFVLNFRDSLGKMRTVIVDTGTEAWALARLARLGKLTQITSVQYTAVNAEFRQLVQLALSQHTCNVLFTHKIRDVYENNKTTGEMERAGFGEIGYDIQAAVKTFRDPTKTGVDQFGLEITASRANLGANGKRFIGGDCTFAKVACAIYPKTTEENWK
jgi:hypothetical protein